MTANEKYSLRNRTSLPQPIQMKLSEKEKNVCEVVPRYLKIYVTF